MLVLVRAKTAFILKLSCIRTSQNCVLNAIRWNSILPLWHKTLTSKPAERRVISTVAVHLFESFSCQSFCWGNRWDSSCQLWIDINHQSLEWEGGKNSILPVLSFNPDSCCSHASAGKSLVTADIWSGWWDECLPPCSPLPASKWWLRHLSHLLTH